MSCTVTAGRPRKAGTFRDMQGRFYAWALIFHTFALGLNIASGRSSTLIIVQILGWFGLAFCLWRRTIR